MSKEINDIIRAFKIAQGQGRKTALATVVHVEGSSYRRPGARMLVEENGKMTGAISGGCLEGDALRKALQAINQRQNRLVTYNTLHDDDVEFGVQLGCNGIVHILFEPISPDEANHPIALLEKCLAQRTDAAVITLFSLENYYGLQPGTCFFSDGATSLSKIKRPDLEANVKAEARRALSEQTSLLRHFAAYELTAFVERLKPPVSLVIVGAGNDAFPLVDMATVLGWQITVLDGRSTHATRQRFPRVAKILVSKPAEAVPQLTIDDRTVFVLMTHNFNYDLNLLSRLLQEPCGYIGVLGPKKRMQRLLTTLAEQDIVLSDEQRSRIFGPIGLDIGAEGAEEIALSILPEIKAALAGRGAGFLRDRPDRIHSASDTTLKGTQLQGW